MIVAIDVGYQENLARAACVAFEHWDATEPQIEVATDISDIAPYVPGNFYLRELPCIEAVLSQLDTPPETIVIDGFVWLDSNQRKGLGGFLFEKLNEQTPVIGVAKTPFATATYAKQLFRGESKRPLYISSAGIELEEAFDCIESMHGTNRIPTLLQRVDRNSRFKTGSE